jgi:hypothetical protein
MDIEILKKRLSTFRTQGGFLTRVSDDLLMDILKGWESWSGKSSAFYRALGVSKRQLGGLISKAKRLARDGHFVGGEFQEIKLATGGDPAVPTAVHWGVEMSWDQGKVIRFSQVEQLVDFLKKVA